MRCLEDTQPVSVQPLRLATWNLQSCRRGIKGVVSHLKLLDADLVGLQEVDCRTTRASGIDQTAYLAEQAGYHHFQFFKAVDWPPGDYGLALLSRWPIAQGHATRLFSAGHEQRILTSTLVQTPHGRISVHVTHLAHAQIGWRLRSTQARQIVRHLAGIPGPKILLGDFNALPGSAAHRTLHAEFVDVFSAVGQGAGGTRQLLPWVTLRIDYVFASPDLLLRQARVARTNASDHHALVAEMSINPLSNTVRRAKLG